MAKEVVSIRMMDRLVRGAKNAERLMAMPNNPYLLPPNSPSSGSGNVTVRVTGPVNLNGLYPAVMTYLNLEIDTSSSQQPSWFDGEECYAFPLNTSDVMVVGTRYVGRIEGTVPYYREPPEDSKYACVEGQCVEDSDGEYNSLLECQLSGCADAEPANVYYAVVACPVTVPSFSEVVTSVCIEKTFSSGYLVDVDITVGSIAADGTEDCVENPSDCCEVESECGVCEGVEIPATLYALLLPDCGPASNEPVVLAASGGEWVSEGEGCGGGGGGGGYSNSEADCCEDGVFTETTPILNLAVTMASGGATCLPTPMSLTSAPGSQVWQTLASGCIGNPIVFAFSECGVVVPDKHTMVVSHSISPGVFSDIVVTLVSQSCDPYEFVYDVSFPDDTVPGGGTARITITVPS